jgi:hypothetical protein
MSQFAIMKGIYFAAMFLAFEGVQQVSQADDRGAIFSVLFTNALFRDVVIPTIYL